MIKRKGSDELFKRDRGERRPKRHNKQEIKKEISRLEELVFKTTSTPTEITSSNEADIKKEDPELLPSPQKKVAAWQDEEDLALTVEKVVGSSEDGRFKRVTSLPERASSDSYHRMLKEQFKGVVGTPQWATLTKKEEEDDFVTKVLRSSSQLLQSGGTLAPNKLNYTRLADMNEDGIVQKTIIKAIDFNRNGQVSAVANRSGNVTFYQVDGVNNTVVYKTAFKNFPISSAKFALHAQELLIGSEYKASMQCYDLMSNKTTIIPSPTQGPEISSMEKFSLSGNGEYIAVAGRGGVVALLTSDTKELIHTVKMSGHCKALTFSSDSSKLLTYGDEGKVYVWDVRQRKCLHRFVDEGCLGGISLSLSAGDMYLACGSTSGVVNLYDGSDVMPSTGADKSMYPQPAKAIMNLTTEADTVIFNPTGQILAISSNSKDSALKLVHLPSVTVFANFPNPSHDLGRVEVVAFSPNSGYMAVGNNIGGARLFRLHHFSNY